MISPDFYIKAVQDSKRQFVNTFVTNDAIKTSLLSFVDAQEEFTKTVAKSAIDITSVFVKGFPFTTAK